MPEKALKICTIIGTRPQFIKAAALSRAMTEYNIKEIIIHTGQHYDGNMSACFFEELKIPNPEYVLSVSSPMHGAMTGEMLQKIEPILIKEKPDYVLVYGDTNTTLAGALAASKLLIPIIHVEAGMRSFNMKMPEEINRIITDNLSSILLCPSKQAVQNLLDEGFGKRDVVIEEVGDIMYDAILFYKNILKPSAALQKVIPKKFILATIHRQENADNEEKLTSILEAFGNCKDNHFIMPLHPRTKKNIDRFNIVVPNNVLILDPVAYSDMLCLLDRCDLVVTDSGGLQREAYFMKKFCVIIRDETEWTELVQKGVAFLGTSDKYSIQSKILGLLQMPFDIVTDDIYGDGNAHKRILQMIVG